MPKIIIVVPLAFLCLCFVYVAMNYGLPDLDKLSFVRSGREPVTNIHYNPAKAGCYAIAASVCFFLMIVVASH